MMRFFDQPEDATLLTPDDKKGLLAEFVTTRAELNRVEHRNMIKGRLWAFARKRDVLETDFLRILHRHMFGEVWNWAGTFRTSERNIGVAASNIAPMLHDLVEDAKVQIQFESYSPDEIAVRFHHRLTAIHPFPNRNGRHARLATDLLTKQLAIEAFAWGAPHELATPTENRRAYISALRALDHNDAGPLMAFLPPPTN